MIVYLLLNTVNNKGYVGKHKGNTISTRWREDLSGGHNVHLENARKKYGWKIFSIEILNICSSKEEMNNLERLWILALRTYDPDYGYNMTYGGEGNIPTEETKKLLREARLKWWKEHPDYEYPEVARLQKRDLQILVSDTDEYQKRYA